MSVDVTQNIGLVHHVIRRRGLHRRIHNNANLDEADLVQAGTMGLMRAAQTFDPERGCAFATYASWWVRHHVARLIENESCSVHQPVHVQARRRKAGERAHPPVFSLNAPVQDDTSMTHLDCLVYPAVDDDDDTPDVLRGVTLDALIAATTKLDERQILVLRERAKGRTLKEIGDEIGLSRERVRQLEALAFNAIRAANNIKPPPKPPPKPPKRDAAEAERKRQARHRARLEALTCSGLSEQERHVLAARAQGRMVWDVARELGVSRQRVSEIESLALAQRLAERAPA